MWTSISGRGSIVLLARDGKVLGRIADAEEDVMIVFKSEDSTGG